MKQLFRLPFLLLTATSFAIPVSGQTIPPELLEDEHVREEFGINEFTTPSIRKIFEILRSLRPLPYEDLKREIPSKTDTDRTKVAITLGFLIADGFYAVEAEQFLDLEPVGLSLLDHAKAIGAGERIKSHTKSLLDQQNLRDWNSLKAQLSETQRDVEIEMVQIRDVDLAHLIALGGWLRAFEIGCAASLEPYDPEKASVIAKPMIVHYFIENLRTMERRLHGTGDIPLLIRNLEEIQAMTTLPEQEAPSRETVENLEKKISGIVDQYYGKRITPVE